VETRDDAFLASPSSGALFAMESASRGDLDRTAKNAVERSFRGAWRS
jgi:hypothetical protein